MSDYRNDNFLVAVFKSCSDDMKFLKKQQWTITYYCLLLYAAIVAVFKTYLTNALCIERGILLVISTAICVIGCSLISKFEKSIKDTRVITKGIYASFPEVKKIVFAKTSSGYNPTDALLTGYDPTDVRLIRYTLIATLIIGLVIVGWLLYREENIHLTKYSSGCKATAEFLVGRK